MLPSFRPYSMVYVLALTCGFSLTQKSYAQRAMAETGIIIAAPVSAPVKSHAGIGVNIAYLWKTGGSHYLGCEFSYFYSNTQKRPIHIPNNLMSDETLSGKMNIPSIALCSYLEVPSSSAAKLTLTNKLGMRWGIYAVHHQGDVLFIPDDETIYRAKSFGLMFESALGVYIPVAKNPLVGGIHIKTGVQGGSKLKYEDPDRIQLVNNEFVYVPEQTFGATYWLTTISFIKKI